MATIINHFSRDSKECAKQTRAVARWMLRSATATGEPIAEDTILGYFSACFPTSPDFAAKVLENAKNKPPSKHPARPKLDALILKEMADAVGLVEQAQLVSASGFITNAQGVIFPKHQGNVRLALSKLGYTLAFDALSRVHTWSLGEQESGPLDDQALERAWLACDAAFKILPPIDFFKIVMEDACRLHTHHPVLTYLDSLPPWDGIERLDTWLITYAGAADTPFNRAVGVLPLLAAVRRCRQPGSKFDELLVLIGAQGAGKSKTIAMLSPNPAWYTDSLQLGDDPKHTIENTRGIWLVEIGEMQGLSQREVERVKVFLSRAVDGPVRMSYARLPVREERQFVCFGSTNDTDFLRDRTGNRRFWPVQCGTLLPELLKQHRDQLWAEVVRRETMIESLHLSDALWSTAAEVQEAHREVHPWEDALQDRLDLTAPVIPVEYCWRAIGFGDTAKRDNRPAAIIKAVMSQAGYVEKRVRVRSEDGKSLPVRCWTKDPEQGMVDCKSLKEVEIREPSEQEIAF